MKLSKPGEKHAELRYQQLLRIASSGHVLTEREREELLALRAKLKGRP